MRKNVILLLLVIAAIIGTILLVGCGGSDKSSTAPTAAVKTGRATLTVRWPERSRLIPFASESINVRIARGTQLFGEKLLTRPENGGNASVTFEQIPTGNATVSAVAYPNADGSGVAQAEGNVPVAVVADKTADVHLTLGSTIAKLTIAPETASLKVGESITPVATAYNSTNEAVLIKLATLAWASDNSTIVTVEAGGKLNAFAVGTATITVTDTESKKTATIQISVTSSGTLSVYTNDFEQPVGTEWSSQAIRTDPLDPSDHSLGGFTNNTVSLSLHNLAPHTSVTISFDLYILNSWDGNGPPPISSEIWSLHVANGGPLLLYTNFSNNEGNQSYPGTFPTDSYPARTGAKFSNPENPRYTVYRISKTFTHNADSVQFDFTASGLEDFDQNETWALDDVEVSIKP